MPPDYRGQPEKHKFEEMQEISTQFYLNEDGVPEPRVNTSLWTLMFESLTQNPKFQKLKFAIEDAKGQVGSKEYAAKREALNSLIF